MVSKEKTVSTEKFSPELLERRKRRMKWMDGIRRGKKIGSVTVIMAFLFMLFWGGATVYFDISGKNDQFTRAVATLAELYGSGTKVDHNIGAVSLSPLLTQTVTTKLYRQVGEWKVITGELHAKKSLFGGLRYTIKETPKYLDGYAPASFGMPMSLVYGGTDGTGNKEENALKQLNRIEDGFVAEMGFSLGKGIAPDQLAEMLSEYDLWILGMAVYSGEIKEVKVSNYSSSGDAIYAPHLTLRPYMAYTDDGFGKTWFTSISKDDVKMAADQMIKDLEWLTSRVNYDGAGEDKQRLAYLKSNGMQVFGAVVTGPVRELEKLKQVPGLRDLRLGRIEVWNWEKHKTSMP